MQPVEMGGQAPKWGGEGGLFGKHAGDATHDINVIRWMKITSLIPPTISIKSYNPLTEASTPNFKAFVLVGDLDPLKHQAA